MTEIEDWDFRIKIANIIRTFRIYKEGKIEAPNIFLTNLKQFQNIKPRFVKNEKLYELDLAKLPEIIKLYEKINKFNNPKFNLISERFDNAISINSSIKNAYVDLVGILESILLPDIKSELCFRFSLLLANLLNIIGEEITFKEVKEIYDIRSSLAHSGDSKKFNDEKFFTLLRYTRIIIKWYIENNLNDKKAQEILFETLKLK